MKWKVGTAGGCVVSDIINDYTHPSMTINNPQLNEEKSYYGGYLVCESTSKKGAILISKVPELLKTIKDCQNILNDYLHPSNDLVDSKLVISRLLDILDNQELVRSLREINDKELVN